MAAKISATCIRGQFYGLAAAIGKIGAFAGAYAFEDVPSLPAPPRFFIPRVSTFYPFPSLVSSTPVI
jgi:hypothetical protein